MRPLGGGPRASGNSGTVAAVRPPPSLTRTGSNVAVAGAFVAAYVGLEWVSSIHEYEGLPVTLWNPGLGLVFALMMLTGALGGVALFVGVILSETIVIATPLRWPIILGIGVIVSAGYMAVAAAARRLLRFDIELARLRDVLTLLAAGVAGAAIVAILLSAFLVSVGQISWDDVPPVIAPLFVGDTIGIAVMTPAVLRFARRRREMKLAALAPHALEAGLYAVVIGALLWFVIGTETGAGFKYFYAFFVPVVAVAVRLGFDGACVGLAVTQLGLVGVLQYYGYNAAAFTEFQTLMFVLTATGLIVGVVVSERKAADRLARAAEARLREKEAEAVLADRFSLVSGMASALAHEINQPMTAARALARSAQELLRANRGETARVEQNLAGLVAQIDHAGGILRRMRDFLRRGQPRMSTIDVRELIDDALALVRPEASENRIGIELDMPETLPVAHGDRIQIQQVLLNLVRNAIEAIAGVESPVRTIRISVRVDPGRQIVFGVIDSGPGIRADLAPRLFEPLTTSKRTGLGLGLSICASIVEAHGGRIWLESSRPGATEFRFTISCQASI
jgi:signal transduction histidine kinase